MSNQREMVNELEFESLIKAKGDREVAEFTARQVYDMRHFCIQCDRRLKVLEKRNQKQFGLIGGLGAVIGTAFSSAIDYLLRR